MTDRRKIYEAVKAATVAVILETPEREKPFTIIGSGFCIHPEGIVVTCEHVHRAFFDEEAYKRVMAEIVRQGEPAPIPVEMGAARRPTVMFFGSIRSPKAIMPIVPVAGAVAKTDADLAVYKLAKHKAFVGGYPTLSIAEYESLYEMMEIGLCGFPLGDSLFDQIGTASSSFTTGRLSSIIPLPGVPKDDVKGFQLDLTATNGNSGGPVFSLETGEVFGVLQRGVSHPATGNVFAGLVKAEPIYRALEHDLIERLLKGQIGPATG